MDIKLKIQEYPKEISYDDILAKLGVTMIAGKLLKTKIEIQPQLSAVEPVQNNYIYNKYFNQPEIQTPKILKPKTIKEYKEMLIKQNIDEHNRRHHVNTVKSKKLIMPGNVNTASRGQELNTLFKFIGKR